jgi:phosphoglycerate dehydrogenase-like enzyme
LKKLNVLVTKKMNKVDVDYIIKYLCPHHNVLIPINYDEEYLLKNIENMNVILGDYVSERMLKKGNIELIQVHQAGIEKLDLDIIKKYNVSLCNSHSNSLAVAEFAVALILSIAKKIPYHDKLLREGNWNRESSFEKNNFSSNFSSELYSKTIGFIGYGNIGKKISELLNGFKCKKMAIVKNKNKNYRELDFIGNSKDINYVLENSDYVIVAVPLTDETKRMLNNYNLIKMKKSAYLINISRGEIVEEEALYNILKNNFIAGAAIDAWYNYPEKNEKIYPYNDLPFNELDNIIMSPHRADLIYDKNTYLKDAIDNIIRFGNGEELRNIIDLKKGY